ncbi:MAG: hypothetical protein AAF108_00205 [Planctomycetota bacterium]
MPATTSIDQLLSAVHERATQSGVFGPCKNEDGRLSCSAKASAEPAAYRLELVGDELYISLVMQDRWQSESIESDLMHSGDKIEELLEEELVDLGYSAEGAGGPAVEHFRSDSLLFTFRSKVPTGNDGWDPEATTLLLLGYEACFRQLGDMEESGDD